ncbi:hypothetical protein ACGE0T_06875 [Parabacteroides sp. APC149_11_2_Y6]
MMHPLRLFSLDAKDTDTNPNHLVKETFTVTARDKILLPLASDGGAALHIQPVGNSK